jgi:hypothetical protein
MVGAFFNANVRSHIAHCTLHIECTCTFPGADQCEVALVSVVSIGIGLVAGVCAFAFLPWSVAVYTLGASIEAAAAEGTVLLANGNGCLCESG